MRGGRPFREAGRMEVRKGRSRGLSRGAQTEPLMPRGLDLVGCSPIRQGWVPRPGKSEGDSGRFPLGSHFTCRSEGTPHSRAVLPGTRAGFCCLLPVLSQCSVGTVLPEDSGSCLPDLCGVGRTGGSGSRGWDLRSCGTERSLASGRT